MKHAVLIIECEDKKDPGSEGRFIEHMLRLMEVECYYKPARNKQAFMRLLSTVPAHIDLIHITTHGVEPNTTKKQEKFVGFWTPDKRHVTVKEIDAAAIDLRGKTVVSTACFSGRKKPREAFKAATRCKHYIAPIKGPRFYNAALTSHILYHKHFCLKRSVEEAFIEYEDRYKNPHVFCLV